MTSAGPALVLAAMLVVVAIDLGGYLVAAGEAQSAADVVAAAVATDLGPGGRGDVSAAARRLAARNGGRLEACACRRGAGRVTVEVSVPVRALVATRLGPRRVTARATARLVPRP